MNSAPFWSVIVPVYNESSRIGNVPHILSYLKSRKESYELIVVNDGSSDNTLELLQQMNKKDEFTIINYKVNQGKGYAIKQGMLAAQGKYCVFIDVDLATPIQEMDKLPPYIKDYDVVIGTRKTKGAQVVVHQPWLRENLGKGFTFLSQLILGVWVTDFTCGFKCFSQEAAKKIFGHSLISRWGFDSEILFLAKKYDYQIKEIPVTWTDDRRTRVKFPRDLVNSLSELIRIRRNDLYNKY